MRTVSILSFLSITSAVMGQPKTKEITPQSVIEKLKASAVDDVKSGRVKFDKKLEFKKTDNNTLYWSFPEIDESGSLDVREIYRMELLLSKTDLPEKVKSTLKASVFPKVEKEIIEVIKLQHATVKKDDAFEKKMDKFESLIEKIYATEMATYAKDNNFANQRGSITVPNRVSEIQFFDVKIKTKSNTGDVLTTPLLAYRKATAEDKKPVLTRHVQNSTAKMAGIYWYQVDHNGKLTAGSISPSIGKSGDVVFSDQ